MGENMINAIHEKIDEKLKGYICPLHIDLLKELANEDTPTILLLHLDCLINSIIEQIDNGKLKGYKPNSETCKLCPIYKNNNSEYIVNDMINIKKIVDLANNFKKN